MLLASFAVALLCERGIASRKARARNLVKNSFVRPGRSLSRPGDDDCGLGAGWVENECGEEPAFKTIRSCQSASKSEACYSEGNGSRDRKHYTYDITRTRDADEFYAGTVEVEGGVIGLSVSVGVSVAQTSGSSAISRTFTIGEAKILGERKVLNEYNLKLHDEARELLEEDPEEFLEEYGLGYVSVLELGGAFLGTFSFWASSVYNETAITVFVKFTLGWGIFSLQHQEEVKTTFTKYQSEFHTQVDWDYKGGVETDIHPSNPTYPYDLNRTFTSWQDSVHEEPAVVAVRVRPWTQSYEVRSIVNSHPPLIGKLFELKTITPATFKFLSQQTGRLDKYDHSVDQLLAYEDEHPSRFEYSTSGAYTCNNGQHLDEDECRSVPNVVFKGSVHRVDRPYGCFRWKNHQGSFEGFFNVYKEGSIYNDKNPPIDSHVSVCVPKKRCLEKVQDDISDLKSDMSEYGEVDVRKIQEDTEVLVEIIDDFEFEYKRCFDGTASKIVAFR